MYAHAKEVGQTSSAKIQATSEYQREAAWAAPRSARSGMTTQALAASTLALWDMKAKRAGLPLAKLLGAHRDSVAVLHHLCGSSPRALDEVLRNVDKSPAKRDRRHQDQGRAPDLSEDISA